MSDFSQKFLGVKFMASIGEGLINNYSMSALWI